MSPKVQKLVLYTLVRICTCTIVDACERLSKGDVNATNEEHAIRCMKALDYIKEVIPKADAIMGVEPGERLKLIDVLRMLMAELEAMGD